MNLKSLLLVIILLGTVSIIYAQNFPKDTLRYEIIYDYSYQVNKEDTLSKQREQMVLNVAKNFSFYVSLNNMKLNDLEKNWKDSDGLPDRKSLPKTKLHYTIVKEYGTNQKIINDRFGQGTFTYNQNLDKFDWKLQEEQKEILGYSCKKATTEFAGRTYVAWYTTDISISDGPYKFNGLPGLILSIYDTNKHYQFNVASVKNSSSFCNTADQLQKPTQITYEEYKQLKKRYKEKPSTLINSGGMTFPKEMLDLADQRAKEKMKFENNPMELTD
ncbi:GLPGLI family protein [Flavobacterium sp. XS1P32]|uniref:GLPGLI family protein n=1 Tax=unclassified Flavobacterium TaxID=196869 RepID=UPI003AAE2F49